MKKGKLQKKHTANNTTPKKNRPNNKAENPNQFPEESLKDQRELPYEGDDKKGPMEDAEVNKEQR